MFKVIVEIRVENEFGNIVNHKGYSCHLNDIGVQHASLEMAEFNTIENANLALNKVFNINKNVKEIINGD